jgi:tetratricopeptide (TPR) repeat protein
MKTKYVVLTASLLFSIHNFAQKDQLKAAQKALKGGNAAEAVTLLQQAESLMSAASDDEKAQFFFVKGNAMLDLATKSIESAKNLSGAAKSFQDLLAAEKTSGKSKYTAQATTSITDIKNKLVNAAVEQATAKNNKGAADLLKQVYDLDKTDLEKLYYAASYAVNGQEYDKALAYYGELKEKNFTGESTGYYAKSLISEKEEYFATKAERDRMVAIKSHTAPRDEKVPSKKGEIYKNIALIYVQQGKNDEAKKSLSEARQANPDDVSLTMAEADLYLKLNDFTTYKKLVGEVLEKNPNDADLLYNLGVISSKTNAVDAEAYYKKAIAIKPDYTNAYLNLAILKLDAEKVIIDEMNKLGNSEKDNKRYDVLKKQREVIFNDTLPYLEKAYELNPTNEDVSTTLLGVYGALELTEKKKALKAKLGK